MIDYPHRDNFLAFSECGGLARRLDCGRFGPPVVPRPPRKELAMRRWFGPPVLSAAACVLDTKFARDSRAEAYRFLARHLSPPNPAK